jgi:hypothetical protein
MTTKLILPKNLFAKIFVSELLDSEKLQIGYAPSALISKRIIQDENSIGLIPTMDVITYKDIFISSEIGLSFNALLSNSYLHFKEGQETIEGIFLKGDICSNDIILSKVLFKEFYDVDIKSTLIYDKIENENENILIVGDENYKKELFLKGLSFSEEIIELISAPYVNFVLASSSENLLRDFTKKHKSNFSNGHPEKIETLLTGYPETSLDFISVNIQHVVYDLEDQDIEGIKTLLQLPYFHGIVKDMVDIKFA